MVWLAVRSISLLGQEDSCDYRISGRVIDGDTKEPIPFVTIKVRNTQEGTLTDKNGQFLLDNLCDSTNTLVITCIGYCDTICKSHHSHGTSPHFYLTRKVNKLEAVTIQAANNKERGTRTIAQIDLSNEDIGIDPTRSLAASLAGEQGVTFASNGTNVQLPVIHGLYGNRILILNNGFKHAFQNWGRDHAPEIDISSANRIVVLKGAAGVRFGPEALGGAITVENDRLNLNEPLQARVSTGYQTNGRGYFLTPRISQGKEHFSYHIGANYTRIGDRHTPDYSLTNSGKEESSFNGGFRYHMRKLDFKLYYSYLEQDLALLRTSIASGPDIFVRAINSEEPTYIRPFSYEINEPNQQTRHQLAKGEINWWYSDKAKLTFRYGKQLNERQEFDVRRNADRPIIDLDLVTDDYQFEWKHPDWLMLDGLIGFQLFTQLNDNNPGTLTTPFIPNYETTRYSGFIVESFNRDRNTFELGIRVDYESNVVAGRETNQDVFRDNFSFTNFTSSLGYVRELSETSTFRTNFGTAWRTPNMAELYSFGQHGFNVSYGLLRYYFNENGEPRTDRVLTLDQSTVEPERGYKLINEFQAKDQGKAQTVTFFINYIDNFVYESPLGVFGTIRGPMPAFIYRQDDALFIGIDYSWERKWAKDLTGVFGVSYLWSQNVERNEPLINQPPISTNYKLTWTQNNFWFFEESELSIRPSYTFEQFQAPRTIAPGELINGTVEIDAEGEIFDFADAPEGYFLLDIAWTCRWNAFSAGFSVNNVLNTAYRDYLNEMRYFADEPGRNFLFTLTYTFSANSGDPDQ
jgi:iron complex outermembrane receptor protein